MERDGRGQDIGGGKLAAPVFSRIAQQALPLVGVFPKDQGFKAPVLAQKAGGHAPVPRDGAAEVIHELPSYTNGVGQPQGEREAQAAGLSPMPSYVGLSLRRALSLSREQGHPVTVEGSGRVLAQTPGPGTFVSPGVPVKLIAQTR
jgi:cell division protein FtsI (penicillin-binding protein 3)